MFRTALSLSSKLSLTGVFFAATAAADPNFVNVASTREGYGIFANDRAAVNSTGDVIFTAFTNGLDQVFRSTGGGPAALVVDSSGGFETFSNVGINDLGAIAFGARLDTFGKVSVFGGPDPVADDRAPSAPEANYVPGTLARDGTVLFSTQYRSGSRYYDVLYKAKDGAATEYARSLPNSPGTFKSLEASGASLASDGQVAFGAVTGGSTPVYGIFADGSTSRSWVTSQNSSGGVAFSAFYNQGLAANGRLIFAARRGDRTGVFVSDGAGGYTLVAEEGALFNGFDATDNFAERMIIADDGRIAFEASFVAGGRAIYTGSNPATDRLIGTGDALFGSTVTDIAITPGSYASNGNLVFRYGLADGTRGFASARDYSITTRSGISTPQVVPEPGTLAVIGIGLAAWTRRRKGIGK